MGRGGMTLVEVLVVVMILGMLARLAYPNYLRSVERGRTAEARYILGAIRDAETAYYFEHDSYGTLAQLNLTYPTACNAAYYFAYSLALAGGPPFTSFVATANRCTGGAIGKPPQSYESYVVNLTQTGVLGGTPGFV